MSARQLMVLGAFILAACGEAGVRRALTLMEEELRRAMALLGRPTIAGLTRDLVFKR